MPDTTTAFARQFRMRHSAFLAPALLAGAAFAAPTTAPLRIAPAGGFVPGNLSFVAWHTSGQQPPVDYSLNAALPEATFASMDDERRAMEALREGARRWRVALAEAREGGASGK